MAAVSRKASAAPAPTRQERAGETMRQRSRDKLLHAAAEEFAEHGYTGTTVAAVAARAGVSLRTLYTAWGSKRQLLRAYVEYTMTGSATAVTDGTWAPQLQSLLADEVDAERQLRRVAYIFRDVAERMALPWRLMRDAAAVDADVADDQAELGRQRRKSMTSLLHGIDHTWLRPGLTLDQAIDTLMVIASPQAYETLVAASGYSLDDFEEWVATTLIAALLRPPGS